MLLFIMIFTNIGHKVQGEGAGGGGQRLGKIIILRSLVLCDLTVIYW